MSIVLKGPDNMAGWGPDDFTAVCVEPAGARRWVPFLFGPAGWVWTAGSIEAESADDALQAASLLSGWVLADHVPKDGRTVCLDLRGPAASSPSRV